MKGEMNGSQVAGVGCLVSGLCYGMAAWSMGRDLPYRLWALAAPTITIACILTGAAIELMVRAG